MIKALFTECLFSEKDIKTLLDAGVEIKKAPGYLGEEKLIEELQDCDIYIIGGADKASEKVIKSTNLKLINFYGTGYENYVDMEVAKEKGVLVCNTPKANAYTVAEHAVALLLDAVKQITWLNNTTKQAEWNRRDTWTLDGKTLGIVGMGTIGGYIAGIMHRAFNMNILYVSRDSKTTLEKEIGAKKLDLDVLIKESDAVVITASYSPETLNMIGEKELNSMKSHSVLVCTSRAELVNPESLKKALDENKLACAAFDSYYKEPVPTKENDTWGLLSLPDNKFIITPHTAYGSKEAKEDMNAMVIENIISFIKTKKPTYDVTQK